MVTSSDNNNQVVSAANCLNNWTFRTLFRRNSVDENCAHSCGTVHRSGNWQGQSRQDSTLRFRCRDRDGVTTANGFTVTNGDNSFVTTMSHNGGNRDYNFGLGAGEGGSNTCDWDNSVSDGSNSGDNTLQLFYGR